MLLTKYPGTSGQNMDVRREKGEQSGAIFQTHAGLATMQAFDEIDLDLRRTLGETNFFENLKRLSFGQPMVHLSVCPWVCPSVCSFVRLSVCVSVLLSVYRQSIRHSVLSV